MFTNKEISQFAGSFANQLSAGIPVTSVIRRMRSLQPKRYEFWQRVFDITQKGERLSDAFRHKDNLGMLPKSLVSAIAVGERAGNLDRVFKQIEVTMESQMEVNKVLKKLYYPTAIMGLGLAVFVFFMIQVIPSIMGSLGSKRDEAQSWITDLSDWMVMVYGDYRYVIILSLLGGLLLLARHFNKHESRNNFVGLIADSPIIGEPVRKFQYSIWGMYLSIMYAAGNIPIDEQVKESKQVLPERLREPVTYIEKGIAEVGMDEISNVDRFAKDDIRHKMPFMLMAAFSVASQTGDLEAELNKICPILIEEGKKNMTAAVSTLNGVATGVAGLLIAAPMIAYLLQVTKIVEGVQ